MPAVMTITPGDVVDRARTEPTPRPETKLVRTRAVRPRMPRFIAAFEFALALSFFGVVGFQISTLFGKPQRYLQALAPLVALAIAFLSAQLIRRSIFELRFTPVAPQNKY